MTSQRLFNTNEINNIAATLRRRGMAIETATKEALLDGVKKIVRTAKFLAPVKTGKLAESIHYEQEDSDKGLVFKISADAKNDKGKIYARIVEYDPRINRPFMYPAIERCKRGINENLKQALRRET